LFYICDMKDTRDKIINAAVFCLNVNENASIDEIANYLGLNRRTIHRHLKDRENLLQCCLQEMMTKCNQAMSDAYESSAEPIEQVEAMFYAALSIGNEYSFVKKLFNRSSYRQVLKEERLDYESVKAKWFRLVAGLQDSGVINKTIPISWIYNLFGGMIDIAIQAQASGDIAVNDIKSLSWRSFQGSIGMANSNNNK
jgi:AcrR family transcriptional regulator